MKMFYNRDLLGRLIVLLTDDKSVCSAVLSKKLEDVKNLNYIFSELEQFQTVDLILFEKLRSFGFKNIKKNKEQ